MLARTRKDPAMSVATDDNTATPAATSAQAAAVTAEPASAEAVERALAAAIMDATRIGELLDTLRTARLWLPLPDDGAPVTDGGAVTLPTVTYLGSEFVPAYTSADLLARLAEPSRPDQLAAAIPHLVVRAADLARLMPPEVGIALNAGATESVPVYPQGVAFLAGESPGDARSRVSVGPLPAQPEELLSGIRAGLARIPEASLAAAAWLSVQFSGEGLIISVALDDPSDAAVRDAVVAALEEAAHAARHDAGYPIDVTFPGESEPDYIDRWIAAFGQSFYRRG
jgi:SseB protein N-terminal domain